MGNEPLISVTINADSFMKQVNDTSMKMKRVSAMSLNGTAKGIKFRHLPKGMDKHIEGGPTRFTRTGGRWKPAEVKKEKQVAWVYMAPMQDAYLKTIVKGGVRRDDLPVPGIRARLTKHGNLPKNATKGKKVFRIVAKGLPLHVKKIGRKGKKKLKVIAAWIKYRTYKKTFPYFEIVLKGAQKSYRKEYNMAFRRVFK